MQKFIDYITQPITYTRNDKWFYHIMFALIILNDVVDTSISFFKG